MEILVKGFGQYKDKLKQKILCGEAVGVVEARRSEEQLA